MVEGSLERDAVESTSPPRGLPPLPSSLPLFPSPIEDDFDGRSSLPPSHICVPPPFGKFNLHSPLHPKTRSKYSHPHTRTQILFSQRSLTVTASRKSDLRQEEEEERSVCEEEKEEEERVEEGEGEIEGEVEAEVEAEAEGEVEGEVEGDDGEVNECVVRRSSSSSSSSSLTLSLSLSLLHSLFLFLFFLTHTPFFLLLLP